MARRNKIDDNIDRKKIIEDIKKARTDIMVAENFFHFVKEPELIDVAIYELEAKKSRYRYLIKEAKEKGVRKSLQESLVDSIAK